MTYSHENKTKLRAIRCFQLDTQPYSHFSIGSYWVIYDFYSAKLIIIHHQTNQKLAILLVNIILNSL